MKFDVVTIFPEIFDSYFKESILARAQKSGVIEIAAHNLRDFSASKHFKVDDTPYGGGAGMVMQAEPIFRCVEAIKEAKNLSAKQTDKKQSACRTLRKANKKRVILFSAKGKRYTQSDARRLAEYDNLILICGRYEGVDERVAEYLCDEEISIGDFVLTGGEIPAMVLIDSISRLLPGVLGNPQSLERESFNSLSIAKCQPSEIELEYPQYTKPEDFRGWKVPEVLLSGNHREIEEWRKKHSKRNR